MMVRPPFFDLRTRIATALNDGMTVRAAAKRFGVSAETAVRIGQLDRSGKGLMPAKIGGYVKPTLRGTAADAVRQLLQTKSDWMARGLSAELKSAGIGQPKNGRSSSIALSSTKRSPHASRHIPRGSNRAVTTAR